MESCKTEASTAVIANDFNEWYESFRRAWARRDNEKTEAKELDADSTPKDAEERLEVAKPYHDRPASPQSPTVTSPSTSTSTAPIRSPPPNSPPPNSPPLNSPPLNSPPLNSPPPKSLHPKPEYFRNEYFEVKPSAKGGLGSFALKNIPSGTVILSEKPLFLATLMEIHHRLGELSDEQLKKYRGLHYYDELGGPEDQCIFLTNRFSIPGGQCGIFIDASRFNHACFPVASCTYAWSHEEGQMVFTTTKDISEGQEITISYGSYPIRLREAYGFWCDCEVCPKRVDPPEKKRVIKRQMW